MGQAVRATEGSPHKGVWRHSRESTDIETSRLQATTEVRAGEPSLMPYDLARAWCPAGDYSPPSRSALRRRQAARHVLVFVPGRKIGCGPVGASFADDAGVVDGEEQLGFVAVVCGATKANVFRCWGPSHRKRIFVMELQERGFGAASIRSDKRALALVALPDEPLDGCGNVTRVRLQLAAGARPLGVREALAPSVPQQECERAVKNLGEVAIADGVAQKVLHFL